MATVKFSKELRDAILDKARSVFTKQFTAWEEKRPADTWGDVIYDKLYGQYTPAINAVPSMFFTTVDKIRVAKFGDISMEIAFKLSSPRVHPKDVPDTELAKSAGSYYSHDYVLKQHPEWESLFAEVLRWRDEKESIIRKQSEFVTQVNQVINAYETLAPALKMWPPLWELVPERYKERHREIVTRSKKDINVSVDLDKMTAITVAHKLGA
jgi:hypothetical protein